MTELTPTPSTEAIRRIFTATLIIGPSGQGKTSLAATFAEYLWETFHKILLLASCDGGAFPTIIQKRIRQGLIRAWRMRTRSAEGLAFETCHLATKGYWPKVIDPETGETSPAVQLVPPMTAKYDCYCQKGHLLRSVPSAALIVPLFCGECKEMVTVAAMKVHEAVHQTRGFELVGGEFFDGLTSMCGWFMGELDISRGHGMIGGEKPPLGGPVKSGDIVFGGNNRADYGFAQQRAYQLVHNSLGIPNLCEGPIFTALPDDVTEGGGQLPIVGPKLSGSALTADALQWFGNAVEARIEKNDAGRDIRRLYLTEFIDSQNRRHLLKNSGPGTLPKYLEDPPIDPVAPDARHFFSGFHVGHFFKLLDQALRDQLAAEDTVKDVPGLAGTPLDYGEAAVVIPGTAVRPPAATLPATPAPLGGIAPLVPPRPMEGAPTPQAAPPASQGGAPVMAPRARTRKAAMTMPANGMTPVPPPVPVAAATPTPQAAVLPLEEPPVVPVGVVAAPVPRPAGGPPPPPGMRPPQRAPGT
jgi:hypothetical protein